MSNHPKTQGLHHLGLTVPDVLEAGFFFIDALGFEQVGEVPEYPAKFVSDGTTMITLWRAEAPATAVAFDRRKNIGLHHLALRVDPDVLNTIADEFEQRGDVDIEFRPCPLGESGLRHMMCRIPGNIRLELIAA